MSRRSSLSVCEECGLPWGDHDPTCPLALPADWRTDLEPEKRGREEDATYQDPREQERTGP